MTRVLVIEDSNDLAQGLRFNLELEGYDFGHPTIEDALQDLLVPKPKRQPKARAEALAKAAAMPASAEADPEA